MPTFGGPRWLTWTELVPGRILQRQAIRLAEWLTRADYDSVRPADLISQLPCPVLLIESGNDPFLELEDRDAMLKGVAAHRPASGAGPDLDRRWD